MSVSTSHQQKLNLQYFSLENAAQETPSADNEKVYIPTASQGTEWILQNANKSIQKYVSRQSYKKDRYTLSGEESITSASEQRGTCPTSEI